MAGKTVAVVGATGAVGTEMLRVLEKRDFPVARLRLYASECSRGRKLAFKGEEVPVEVLGEADFKGVDIALFSAGSGRSRQFAPRAVADGAVVVDNSSAFRMDPGVPLVIPEINPHAIGRHQGIIANPNCTTIVTLMAVWPLHRAGRVRRMITASYQATSGAGMRAMLELEEQTRAWAAGECLRVEQFPYQIAFNLIPHIGDFGPDGYTEEEMKMVNETRKIFEDEEIMISATTVRVPVLRAHSVAVWVDLERPLGVEEARKLLAEAPGVVVVDDPARRRYPMPLDASGRDEVLVGRIRKDLSSPAGLAMWVSGDQLLKGAALNAVQIAEHLL